MVDFLCERLYWYMQRDTQDKRVKKGRADLERCASGPSEASNYADVLKSQLKQIEKERMKCYERVSLADGKLLATLASLLGKYGNTEMGATPSSGAQKEDISQLSPLLQARLKVIQIESDQWRKDFERERERSNGLEKRLEALEGKFHALSQAQASTVPEPPRSGELVAANNDAITQATDQLRQLSQRLDDLTQASVTQETLRSALGKFDDVISSETPIDTAEVEQQSLESLAGSKAKRRLETMAKSIETIQTTISREAETNTNTSPTVLDLQKQVTLYSETMQKHATQIASTAAAIASVETSLSDLSTRFANAKAASNSQTGAHIKSEPGTEEPLDAKIRSISASLEVSLKERLSKISKDLGAFIDKERQARKSATKRAEESLAVVELLREDITVLKDDSSSFGTGGEHGKRLTKCEWNIANSDSLLQRMDRDIRSHFQAIAMQFEVVNSWQTNFSTKPLYRDIIAHITATLPTGTMKQLSTLTTRVDNLEGQIRGGDLSSKKRKI